MRYAPRSTIGCKTGKKVPENQTQADFTEVA